MMQLSKVTTLVASCVLCAAASAQTGIGFAGAELAATSIDPSGLPVEITFRPAGTPRYEVSLLTPSGASMREITLRASDGALIANEIDALDPSDANFYASVVSLLAGGTIGLSTGGDIALNAWNGWALREIGYGIEAGRLAIESRLVQGGQSILVDVDAVTGTLFDQPPGGEPGVEPVNAAGAISVAENLRPGWVAIEIASTTDSGPAWDVVMLDPATNDVREIEINAANGTVIGDLPVSLTADELSEVQFIASLLPLPITLTEGVDVVLNATGPGEIRFVEFDRENGLLFLIGRVATGSGIVNVSLNPFQFASCQGDADNNGIVNFNDLNVVLINFGQNSLPGANGDGNGDGLVNLADLNGVLSEWGNTCP